MKIISQFRDYYDHEVSYFGYDPTRVYDRRLDRNTLNYYNRGNDTWLYFAICGFVQAVYKLNDKYYFKYTDELKIEVEKANVRYFCNNFLQYYGKTDLNLKFRQPVLLFGCNYDIFKDNPVIVKLSEYGFPANIPSREMYAKIYEFLGFLKDNPPIEDKRTDKEKVYSHGFDVKTSFRPKIKAK